MYPVIKDMKEIKPDGTPNPSPAYETFFKDSSNMPFVAEVLFNVTNHIPVLPPSSLHPVWQAITPSGRLIYWAIKKRGQMTVLINDNEPVDLLDRCNLNGSPLAAYLEVDPPVPLIVLCPNFFKLTLPGIYGDIPPASINGQPASNCLRVNSAKTKFVWPKTTLNPLGLPVPGGCLGCPLIQYRMWILMQEMVRNYVHVARAGSLSVINVNEAIQLSPGDSLLNGPSWRYYAASE